MDVRRDQRLPEHLDDGNRRADRRFEAQLHAGGRCGGEELGAFARDELLVRGHDRFPGPEKLADVAARRLQSAHHLRHNVDGGVVANRREVGRQDAVVGGKAPLLRGIANERANDAQPVAGRALDLVAALGQHAADRRADGAVSQESNAYVN